MYKRKRMYEKVIEVTTKHDKDKLDDVFIELGKELEIDGNLSKAEEYYTRGKEWKLAVHMYRNRDMWDDAMRVGRSEGGTEAHNEILYVYAESQGGEAGIKILLNKGLTERAVEFACEQQLWNSAFTIAENDIKLTQQVQYRYAVQLEQEGEYQKAESNFVQTGNANEAVQMYIHQQDWDNANRVAKNNNLFSTLADIKVAEADALAERGECEKAEKLYINGYKYEKIIDMYKAKKDYDNAKRIAQQYAPHLIDSIDDEQLKSMTEDGSGGVELIMKKVDFQLNRGNYTEAVKIVFDCVKK
eukprot:UN25806